MTSSVKVIRGRFGQRFRRREERVGELWRVGQRPGCLGPLPVGHEPAGDGDGHGHEGQQGRDDERDDEADLGDADLGVGRRRPLRRDLAVGLASLERQDGVGLHLQDKDPECHEDVTKTYVDLFG